VSIALRYKLIVDRYLLDIVAYIYQIRRRIMNSSENNLKVGQDVWINMSSFADDEMWVAGKVLGFTPKRIKCWNEVRGTEGFYAPHKVKEPQ
jgi:hypothetical protein